MNKIDRYVMRHVLSLTGIVALGLLTIYTFGVFVSEIDDTGKGDFGVVQLFEYTVLMMPSSLYILMPIIALLGTLLGIGVLARQSELTAMRAAGVSMLRIGAATLAAGAFLGVITFVVGDWVAPAGETAATAIRASARGGDPVPAIWLRDGQSMLQIGKLLAEDQIGDVMIYRLRDAAQIESITHAQAAHYENGHWLLSDVSETDFGDTHIAVSKQATMVWNGSLNPNLIKQLILEANSLSTAGLVHLISYFRANHLDDSKYTLLLWRKLIEPFTVMVMMLFAIEFGAARFRDSGAGQRLLFGILLGIGFYVANKVCVSYGELYNWPAPLAAAAPTAVLLGLALRNLLVAR